MHTGACNVFSGCAASFYTTFQSDCNIALDPSTAICFLAVIWCSQLNEISIYNCGRGVHS